MKKTWHIAFFCVAALNLFAETAGLQNLIFCTKPLLMPLLLVGLARDTAGVPHKFLRHATLGGLAFATLGDTLLMFPGALFFLLGLGAFLLTHLFYIGGFWSIANLRNGFLRLQPWWALPMLAYPIALLYLLWAGIPIGMKLPVALYASVISGMALSVVNLWGKVSRPIFWMLLAGALLFVLSDSLIAIGKFGQAFPGARWAVMLTYLAGQFLLVEGARRVLKIAHQKNPLTSRP
jgi:uncharacterized membrane protein YhhN